jgi:hypothetical protein
MSHRQIAAHENSEIQCTKSLVLTSPRNGVVTKLRIIHSVIQPGPGVWYGSLGPLVQSDAEKLKLDSSRPSPLFSTSIDSSSLHVAWLAVSVPSLAGFVARVCFLKAQHQQKKGGKNRAHSTTAAACRNEQGSRNHLVGGCARSKSASKGFSSSARQTRKQAEVAGGR